MKTDTRKQKVNLGSFKGVKLLKIKTNHQHSFNLGFKLGRIIGPSYLTLVLAFFGFICFTYLLFNSIFK